MTIEGGFFVHGQFGHIHIVISFSNPEHYECNLSKRVFHLSHPVQEKVDSTNGLYIVYGYCLHKRQTEKF